MMPTRQAAGTGRAYESPLRAQYAAQTRAAVLAAASRLFDERGWAATGMRDVARAAGVAVETVYAGFRSKSELLSAALDVALVGDADAAPLDQRPAFVALGSGTRKERITAAAALVTAVHQRTAGLDLALREAAISDAKLAEHLRECEENRRANTENGMSLVAGRVLTPVERDGLWAVLSVEVYRLLTRLSGWKPEEYKAWAVDSVDRLLDE
jgi:AcrR family transcriptional regulator